MPGPYSPALLASIERSVTKERLARYSVATGGDISRAIELYEYNVRLSEVTYGLLHGLEITVRNAQHHVLTVSYGTPVWYDMVPLSRYWKDKVAKAKAKPGAVGKPGKVIAELTFGFWVDLLQQSNHRILWINRKLHKAFPNTRQPRSFIHDRLKVIQLLRNRISHQEPVLTSRNALYTGNGVLGLAEVIECVEWVCPDTAQWIKTEFSYADAERILREVSATKLSL